MPSQRASRMRVGVTLSKCSYFAAALGFAALAVAGAASAEDNIFGAFLGGGEQPAAAQAPARQVVRVRERRSATRRNKGIENRVNPNRRRGKEGSDEAKIDTEQAKQLYIRRRLRLEQIQSRQRELSRDKRGLATNRARMRARLIEAARALRRSEKHLGEIEDKLSSLRAKIKVQRESLEYKSAQMSELFGLMQGMSREPPPLLITHASDALKMVRSGMVLATFYGDIEKLATQVSTEIGVLETSQKEAELQEQHRKSEQLQNSRLKVQLDLLLAENREQLEANAATSDTLNGATKINMATMRSLEEALPQLDSEAGRKTALAAYEADLKKGVEVSPDAAQTALQRPGRMQPSLPFASSQGLLPLPAQGKVLLKFGQTDQDGTPSKGIHLETRPGAPVISPCDGWVLYSGPFRSYGQLLIINPGGGYHVVIAGMDRIEAQQGQFVLAGEPIAAMGPETGGGDKTPKRPALYVEFRRDQQSIDPEPWWSGGKG